MQRNGLVFFIHLFLIFVFNFSWLFSIEVGKEKILFSSSEKEMYFFPHAKADQAGNVWLIYRKGETHVGSIGGLWLAKVDLKQSKVVMNKRVYTHRYLDPRDPVIEIKDKKLWISFFNYNYAFNRVQQFLIQGDLESLVFKKAKRVFRGAGNTANSADIFFHRNRLTIPIYYVPGYLSEVTDVGYIRLIQRSSRRIIPIAHDDEYFFLEPAILKTDARWFAFWRSSPKAQGPGGIGPMFFSESEKGRKWTKPQATQFIGHHPRISVDSQSRTWVVFRDLSDFEEKKLKAKITVWHLKTKKQITIYKTKTQGKNNWDCGYPSWLEVGHNEFICIYYYTKVNGRRVIAMKKVIV